ncbi:hypothetical protein D3C76_1252170 [compost metagenome]
MSTDAPGVLPAALAQDALAHAHSVCIDDLEGAMAVGSHEPLRYRERMVRRWRSTQVKAHEGDDGGAIGERLHIAGNEAEMPRVPGTGRLVVGHFNDDVAKLEDIGRRNGRALRGIDTRLLVRQVPAQRRSVIQRFAWRLLANSFHHEAGRIGQSDVTAFARMFRLLHR